MKMKRVIVLFAVLVAAAVGLLCLVVIRGEQVRPLEASDPITGWRVAGWGY